MTDYSKMTFEEASSLLLALVRRHEQQSALAILLSKHYDQLAELREKDRVIGELRDSLQKWNSIRDDLEELLMLAQSAKTVEMVGDPPPVVKVTGGSVTGIEVVNRGSGWDVDERAMNQQGVQYEPTDR